MEDGAGVILWVCDHHPLPGYVLPGSLFISLARLLVLVLVLPLNHDPLVLSQLLSL